MPVEYSWDLLLVLVVVASLLLAASAAAAPAAASSAAAFAFAFRPEITPTTPSLFATVGDSAATTTAAARSVNGRNGVAFDGLRSRQSSYAADGEPFIIDFIK